MDVITLKLISGSVAPMEALASLRERQQTAVAVDASGLSLAWASDLADAIRSGLTEVGQLSTPTPIYIPRRPDAQTFGINIAYPFSTPGEYERMLDARGHEYAVLSVGPDSLTVVTRRESLRAVLSGSTLECEGSDRHTYPLPQKKVGDECPRCPRDSKGNRPKIRLAQ